MSRQRQSYAPETCGSCAGTGIWAVSVAYVVSCLVCGGKGRVTVAQPAAPCRRCAGGGRRTSTSPCLNCAGTGWERVFGQLQAAG